LAGGTLGLPVLELRSFDEEKEVPYNLHQRG